MSHTAPHALPRWTAVSILSLLAWAGLSWTAWDWLSVGPLGVAFDAEGCRLSVAKILGGRVLEFRPAADVEKLPLESVALATLLVYLAIWGLGALWRSRTLVERWSPSARSWGWHCGIWLGLLGLWSPLWSVCDLVGLVPVANWLAVVPEFWAAFTLAGLCCGGGRHQPDPATTSTSLPWSVITGVAIYTIVFGLMNTALWNCLRIPHGDSAMYEEHLWNLLHGHGFRSYIDKGLFLGEHIQVVHLLLLPVYVVFPSHLTLEWCESFALGAGAIPVYWLALRGTQSRRAATWLALAYLLYFPMQRLDISLDFKTFRPEAFGIPLLLMTLWAVETRRWRQLAVWGLLTLLVKEDYALVFGPLGVWIGWRAWCERKQTKTVQRTDWLWSAGLAVGSVVYLLLAVKWIIPYFKAGRQVHYVDYFPTLGKSLNEVLLNFCTRPDLWLPELLGTENWVFLTALLVPAGLVALGSPSRLLVGLPLFCALGLNSIARNPQHHFHAPLVAILFWATANGLSRWSAVTGRVSQWLRLEIPGPAAESTHAGRQLGLARFVCAAAFWTGLFHSFAPVGIPFWDSLSSANWSHKYVPDERARQFPKVIEQIPETAYVAATDFIHPRFIHFGRSYDYSSYRPDPPTDTEYLVIDVKGPYSTFQQPRDVPVYREHPDRWELLPDESNGLFWIFRRKESWLTAEDPAGE